ncbi:uncharacterized protein MONBRDRAFT_1409, partial [Monosiga brevicollis MX1]
ITVCGGGNAAHVAAGRLVSGTRWHGADVKLFFSFEDEAKRFREGCERNGGVTVTTKESTYKGMPIAITADPAEGVAGSDVILMITPAFAHEPILKQIAPHVAEGAFVGAIPGPGGFDLLAQHALGDTMQEKDITLFAGTSLPWACRFTAYGEACSLLGSKSNVPVTIKPQSEDKAQVSLLDILNQVHIGTDFPVRGHFLNTTLWPTNAVIHPGVSYGIWHDWDGKPLTEAPLFYQNCNEFTGQVLSKLSDEIMLCKKVIEQRTGADMGSLMHINDYMIDCYGHSISDKSATHRIFATNDAFRGLTAPMTTLEDGTMVPNFNMRYFTEDLPHGLAVLRNIAELCEVETPMMDEVLLWAQEKCGHEYLVNGKIQGKDV